MLKIILAILRIMFKKIGVFMKSHSMQIKQEVTHRISWLELYPIILKHIETTYGHKIPIGAQVRIVSPTGATLNPSFLRIKYEKKGN